MAGARLSKAASLALHSVLKERRLMEFAKSARVDRRTIAKMVKGGYVEIGLIRKVEAQLSVSIVRITKAPADVVETIICTSYGITKEALYAHKRAHNGDWQTIYSEAKQIAWLMHLELSRMSKADIARRFGCADHTTVIYGLKTIRERLEEEKELQTCVERIKTKILAAI